VTITQSVADRPPVERAAVRRAWRPFGPSRSISRRSYLTIAACSFVVLVAVWSLVSALGLTDELFLPSPLSIVERLVEQAQNGQLWDDMGTSVYRVLCGYLLAVVVALPIGMLAGVSAKVEAATEPIVDFVRYMPVVAFVPLTILWVGIGDPQKFLIIWMGTYFQLVLMVSDAVRQVPRSYIDLGATLGMPYRSVLRQIVLPASLPRVWDALRISLGWAWTWLVVAELVAASTGMGYRIMQAQRYFASDLIIAYVLVLGLLGLVFDQLMRAAGRRMFRYQRMGARA